MITKAEFLKLSSKPTYQNPRRAGGLWLDRYFTRKVSPHVAYGLASVNISANAATLAFFVLGLAANVILAIPVWWTPLAVLGLYAVVRVVDEADGRLARYYKTQSKFGEALDIFSELLLHSTFFFALGIRLYLETGTNWALVLGGIGVLPYLYEGPWVKISDELVGPFEASQPTTFWSRVRTIYVNYDYILFTVLITATLYGLQSLFNVSGLVLVFFSFHVLLSIFVKVVLRFLIVLRHSGRGTSVEERALPREKILPLPDLVQTLENARKGKRVVYFSWVFDLFHFGHFKALKRAAALGDILVVLIHGDALTKSLKGQDRPYLGETFRAEMIAAFWFVDYVFVANTPMEDPHTLRLLCPDVMVRAKRSTESDELRRTRANESGTILPRVEVVWLEETPEISTTLVFPVVKNGNGSTDDKHYSTRPARDIPEKVSLKPTSRKIHTLPELVEILSAKRKGKKVVLFAGVFDLFHFGHFKALKKAAGLGDILVVKIDSDTLTKQRKGAERPSLGESFRAEMISDFSFVDYVFISDYLGSDYRNLQVLRPDIMASPKRQEESDESRATKIAMWAQIVPQMEVIWLEETPEISTSLLFPVVAKNGNGSAHAKSPLSELVGKSQEKKRPTVTVALSVYNEQENIKNLLLSVLNQDHRSFILEKVLVISDGSTDRTVEEALSLQNDKIDIRANRNRLGKSARLNEIYGESESDIVVHTDADVVFANTNVLNFLIDPILSDASVGMTSGKSVPLPGRTFTEKAVNRTVAAYDRAFRSLHRQGQGIPQGRCLAVRKEVYKKISVPVEMIGNDHYLYLSTLNLGYIYRFIDAANVLYRSPRTAADQIRQNTRFLESETRWVHLFPERILAMQPKPASVSLTWHMLREFLRHPALCSYIFVLNTYCRLLVNFRLARINGAWDVSYSTKKL